ncbi:MAG TPA: heme-binding protein [Steroidobacteraceae bacterium]|jgi:glc operon protein GlcG|nr:heme-binding protein [Steroidobacteraceae bacterium]
MSPRLALTAVLLAAVAAGTASSGAQQPAPAAAPYPLDDVPEKMPFDIPYGAPIPLERAMAAIAATVAEAKKHDWKLDVAVVDSGGNLVAFQRMDGAQLASIQVAEHKARASVTFRRETKVFEKAIQQAGNYYVMTLDGVIGSRGGIPLVEGGKLIGGIGCSGGTGSQDEVACKAGVAAISK